MPMNTAQELILNKLEKEMAAKDVLIRKFVQVNPKMKKSKKKWMN